MSDTIQEDMGTRARRTTEPIQRLTYYSAPFDFFVRTDKNLRGDVDRPELINQLKADGGVRVPIFVLPSKYDQDGKRVIWDGNSRHYAIEKLSTDPEYTGSLELPFILIPESVADDPTSLTLWMLSFGSTNKQLTPKEYGKGIVRTVDELVEQKLQNIPPSERPNSLRSLKLECKKLVAEKLNVHTSWIDSLLRVWGSEENEILDAVDLNLITIGDADTILSRSRNMQIPVKEFVDIADISAKQRGKKRISTKDVERTSAVLNSSKDVVDYVLDEKLSVELAPEIEKAAKSVKLSDKNFLEHALGVAQEMGNLMIDSQQVIDNTVKSLSIDVENLHIKNLQPSDEPEQEENQIKEINQEDIEKAAGTIHDFVMFLNSWYSNDFVKDESLIPIAKKIEKLQKSFFK